MKNFAAVQSFDMRTGKPGNVRYRFRLVTGEPVARHESQPNGERETPVVDVEVYYEIAKNRRGVTVSAMRKTVGAGFESFMIDFRSSTRSSHLVRRLKRMSAKDVAAVAELLDAEAPEMARLFAAGNVATAFARMEWALAPDVPSEKAVYLAALEAEMAKVRALAAGEARQAEAAAECGGCANGEHCNACDCCGDDSEDPTSAEWTAAKQAAQDAALKSWGVSDAADKAAQAAWAKLLAAREEYARTLNAPNMAGSREAMLACEAAASEWRDADTLTRAGK